MIWISLILFLALLRQNLRISFYKSYFRTKQKGLGHDPDVVLQLEFPWIWWILR